MTQPERYALLLDDCVARLRRGETAEACLSDHPALVNRLGPDLTLSAELMQLAPLQPAPKAVESGLQQLLAEFDQRRPATPRLARFGRLADRWRRPALSTGGWMRAMAITILLLLVAGSFVVTAAADTLPGDTLYPVKRSWETVQLTLATNERSRQALETRFERRRRAEVEQVLQQGKPVVVEFKGVLQSAGDQVWRVDDLEIQVTGDTRFQGRFTPGQKIGVRAQAGADGALFGLLFTGEAGADPPLPGVTPSATATPSPTPVVESLPLATVLATDQPRQPNVRPPAVDEVTPTRPAEAQPTDEATPTRALSDQPAIRLTSTPTPTGEPRPSLTPALDAAATPRPSRTPSLDAAATATPTERKPTPTPAEREPTATPVEREPTPTPALDNAATATPIEREPTPTPADREPNATPAEREPTSTPRPTDQLRPTPTPTRSADGQDGNDQPP